MVFTQNNYIFSDTNNVSFNLSGSSVVTMSHNLAGTGTAITGGALITLNSTGLSFDGAKIAGTATAITGLASITMNSAGLSFNGTAMAGTNTASTGANFAWTVNSSGISINGSNIAGTTTAITGRASVTLDSGGYRFNGNGIAGTGFTTGTTTGVWTATNSTAGLSMVMPYRTRMILPSPNNLTALTAPGNASMSIQYIDVPVNITGTRIDALMGMSHSSSGGAGTVTIQFSRYCIIYTKNANTLSSLSSGSTQTTYTYASNTAGATYLTNSAIYPMSVPVNFNMPPGEYWVGFNQVTATTAASMTISVYGVVALQTAVNYADFAATATSSNIYNGVGVFSVATTGIVTRLSMSDINQTGSALSAANIALVFRNA